MRRWLSFLALIALPACEDSRGPADPMQKCMEGCSVNVGVCQQGCANDAECKRSCAKANEMCTIACTRNHAPTTR